jgi:hypothetical protein
MGYFFELENDNKWCNIMFNSKVGGWVFKTPLLTRITSVSFMFHFISTQSMLTAWFYASCADMGVRLPSIYGPNHCYLQRW